MAARLSFLAEPILTFGVRSLMKTMAIFVDGANCFYAQRNLLGWHIDWGRLLNLYRRDFDVVAARYYRAVLSPQPVGDIAFGNFLRIQGFAISQKEVKETINEETGKLKRKGNLDVELTIDALLTANQYDVCLLVSGDGDFAALAQALRVLGKRVKVLSTRGIMAGELLDEVGLDYEDLAGLRAQLEYSSPLPMVDTIDESEAIDPTTPPETYTLGAPYSAQVLHVTKKGAYVSTPLGTKAFLPISRLGIAGYIDDASTLLEVGEVFRVRVDSSAEETETGALRVEMADLEAQARIQEKFESQRVPFDDIPESGEFDLTVSSVQPYGAFLQNPWGAKILLHITTLGLNAQCDDCSKIINKGESVRVAVNRKYRDNGCAALDVQLVDPYFGAQLQQRLSELNAAGDDV